MSGKAEREAGKAAGTPAEAELPVEETLKQLEAIVEGLEGGRLDLDASFAKFEEAVKLSRSLKKRLDSYERKLELVTGVDASGKPLSEPFPEKADGGEG